MKKILMSVITVMIMFTALSGVYAVSNLSILDLEYSENMYKFSESTDIKLPFIRVSSERMEIDKDLSKSGLSFSEKSISVLNNLKGVQILCSSDTVKVTGNMEFGVIMAPTVIIEGTIDRSIIIISKDVTVDKTAVIKEDLFCFSSNFELLGSIEGSLLGIIENVSVSGNISQDLRTKLSTIKLDSSSNVKGNIYIGTTNENINISDKYPNAVVNVNEVSYGINIWSLLRNSLILALIYLLISSKTNIIKKALEKVRNYWKTTVIAGSASILALPIIVIAIVILMMLELEIVALPIAIFYSAFMIIAFTLSSFVVGSLISEYAIDKYKVHIKGTLEKFVLSFCVILLLNLITNIPYAGYTLSIALCILSVGILFTVIFKKNKNLI